MMANESNHDGDEEGLMGIREAMKEMQIKDGRPASFPMAKIKKEGNIFGNGNSNNNTTSNSSSDNNTPSIFSQIRNWSTLSSSPSPSTITPSTNLIGKEFLKLNLHDRNAIYEEIHGVRTLCPDELPPEMVDIILKEMDRELWSLPSNINSAYKQSQKLQSPSYVNDRDFRLRFVRAALFNAKEAAVRFASFLVTAVELFGMYALERPIRLSDFNKQELRVFNSGRVQLAPFRDRAGRRVIVGFPPYDHDRFDHRTRAKVHLYLWLIASEDIETQRKGMTMVIIHNPAITDVWDKKNDRNSEIPSSQDTRVVPSAKWASLYASRRRSLPLRICAYHLCTPDTPYYQMLHAFNAMMMKADERCRMKIHVGQSIENRYELNGYGIPVDQFPITETGKIKTTYLKKWLQLRKSLEDVNSDLCRNYFSIIECPRSNDVIFKPSQSMMSHAGNSMFRSVVESKHYEHSIATTREAKMEITRSVIGDVKRRNGRFLVWNNTTWWNEMKDEKLIYAKIAIFFRNSKVSVSAKSNRQTTSSSTFAFATVSDQVSNRDDKRRKISSDDEEKDGVGRDNACFGFKL